MFWKIGKWFVNPAHILCIRDFSAPADGRFVSIRIAGEDDSEHRTHRITDPAEMEAVLAYVNFVALGLVEMQDGFQTHLQEEHESQPSQG